MDILQEAQQEQADIKRLVLDAMDDAELWDRQPNQELVNQLTAASSTIGQLSQALREAELAARINLERGDNYMRQAKLANEKLEQLKRESRGD